MFKTNTFKFFKMQGFVQKLNNSVNLGLKCSTHFLHKQPVYKQLSLGTKFITAWKVSKYGVFSGSYFPTFRLNTERYGVSLRIQSIELKYRGKSRVLNAHMRSTKYWSHVLKACLLLVRQKVSCCTCSYSEIV